MSDAPIARRSASFTHAGARFAQVPLPGYRAPCYGGPDIDKEDYQSMKKRIISLLLCAVMLLPNLTVRAAAANSAASAAAGYLKRGD